MKKIFSDNLENGKFVLTGDDHAHLAYALRARVGDEITVCNDGVDYYCKIRSISKKETVLEPIESKVCDAEPTVAVTLYFAAMKGDKNELVAQKCTELGVKCLRPFISSNCECRAESVKIERINKIITEAAQQCGRGMVPHIDKIRSFDEVLYELRKYDKVVFPYERATDKTLKDVLRNSNGNKCIAIIIGSEGGFTEKEADALTKIGVTPITLGKRILRAETASIAVVAAVMYEENQWKIN